MVLLPVVERELRVASRGRATYRVRFWSVVFMLGIFAWGMQSFAYFNSMSQQGGVILPYLTLCAYVYSLLVGTLVTADSVSREKRDGTLGLLFLTDLKGHDVVCGKLAAHSINALYSLVASLPVLSIPLLMGGVTFVQFAKIALVLVSTMVLSLCVGIFVSTFSRDERKAMIFTFFFMAAMFGLPLGAAYWFARFRPNVWMELMFIPGYGLEQTLGRTGFPAASFWFSVNFEWAVSAVLIAAACRHVPNS